MLNVLGGGTAKRLAIESRYNGRGYVPWAGVAAQIAKQEPGKGTQTTPAVQGQAFTFLPLPVKTGLPIHVSPHSLSNYLTDWWSSMIMSFGLLDNCQAVSS